MSDTDRVLKLADTLNLALAGEPSNLVETVLSLVAATAIIVNHPETEWARAVQGLSSQVSAILGSEKHVAFIRGGVRLDNSSPGKN